MSGGLMRKQPFLKVGENISQCIACEMNKGEGERLFTMVALIAFHAVIWGHPLQVIGACTLCFIRLAFS